jgi:hypothetical protein
MAAKGSILKQEIAQKILEVFPNSFLYNDGKEVRINGMENGVPTQIKITLTAAKVPVEGGSSVVTSDSTETVVSAQPAEKVPDEPTAEEQKRLQDLLAGLGL